MKLSSWIRTLPIPLIALFAGCTSIPVGKYHAFKEASQGVLNNTTNTFTRIEKMQAHFEIVVAPNKDITDKTFDPPSGTDLTPELRFREDALDVLVKYADALDALASKDYGADVDTASIKLAASLGNMVTTSKLLSGDKATTAGGIAATLADVFGREIIREKRINALKQAMDKAQGPIESLSRLIVADNAKFSAAVGVMLDRIIAHANTARPAFGTNERILFDEGIAEQIFEARAVKASLDSISTAVQKVPAAHREIRKALDTKSSSIESLKALVQEAQRANKFYRGLKNK